MSDTPSILARLNYQIWHYDDLRNFNKVKRSAKTLFRILGYKKSETIARHVTKAYHIYAKLDDKTKITREKIQRNNQTFLCVEKEIFKAADIVNPNIAKQIAKYHAEWWFYFFKKKNEATFERKLNDYFQIIYFIYKQHKVKHSKTYAVVLTILLFLAGLLGHNRRNKRIGELFLTQYWRLTLKVDQSPIMF